MCVSHFTTPSNEAYAVYFVSVEMYTETYDPAPALCTTTASVNNILIIVKIYPRLIPLNPITSKYYHDNV